MNPLRAIWRRLSAGRIPSGYLAHRRRLLAPPTSDRILDLEGVRRAARDLSGDPDDLRMFGLETDQWYHLGIRILGRSAVEMTRDPPARFMASVVAKSLRASDVHVDSVVDLFVGTGNILFHCLRETGAPHGLGVDSSRTILELTAANFSRLPGRGGLSESRVDWIAGDWREGLTRAGAVPAGTSILVVVCPPWGHAYTTKGLDLRHTSPPIPEILREISRHWRESMVHAVIPSIPRVVADSLAALKDNSDSSRPHGQTIARSPAEWTTCSRDCIEKPTHVPLTLRARPASTPSGPTPTSARDGRRQGDSVAAPPFGRRPNRSHRFHPAMPRGRR